MRPNHTSLIITGMAACLGLLTVMSLRADGSPSIDDRGGAARPGAQAKSRPTFQTEASREVADEATQRRLEEDRRAGHAELRGELRPPVDVDRIQGHREMRDDEYIPPRAGAGDGVAGGTTTVERDGFVSVQVNVNMNGMNILGDAANEPSLAVDPTAPGRIVIGWRQFDTVDNNFRQAGWAFSTNGGQSWERVSPGVIEPGIFRSDPVLGVDADGVFHYYSLGTPGGAFCCDVFSSVNGGMSWGPGSFAYGGDKGWMTIDRTNGMGRNHIYTTWNRTFSCDFGDFVRSTNCGFSFEEPIVLPGGPFWGTLSVGPDGELYICGNGFIVMRSDNAKNPNVTPTFEQVVGVNLGGVLVSGGAPNPGGLNGQAWIATDHSESASRGNVYLLATVNPEGPDPADVMFSASTDGGQTWSSPCRVNDDDEATSAWQWFGTMSVAPNGRIDVIFNDTRNSGASNLSELFYTYSVDTGKTWAPNVPVSPMFNSIIGWPNQAKIGDYYDMTSDNEGANIAYSATFNGEQDVWFLRIGEFDCNANGLTDSEEIERGLVDDCNDNGLPDDCEVDCNNNGIPDGCDVAAAAPDCDGNFIPDECESDFDGDGVIDACDDDIDGDDVLNAVDPCDFTLPSYPLMPDGTLRGDTSGDCRIDEYDFGRFANTCLLNGGPDVPLPSSNCLVPFDYDDDGDIDMHDCATLQTLFGEGAATINPHPGCDPE